MNHRCNDHELFYNPSGARKHYRDYADKTRVNGGVDFFRHHSSDLCVHLHPGMLESLLKDESG